MFVKNQLLHVKSILVYYFSTPFYGIVKDSYDNYYVFEKFQTDEKIDDHYFEDLEVLYIFKIKKMDLIKCFIDQYGLSIDLIKIKPKCFIIKWGFDHTSFKIIDEYNFNIDIRGYRPSSIISMSGVNIEYFPFNLYLNFLNFILTGDEYVFDDFLKWLDYRT